MWWIFLHHMSFFVLKYHMTWGIVMKRILLIVTATMILSACGQPKESNKSKQEKVTVTVSAAASLKDALSEIEKNFEKEHKNIDVKFNYGASGALAQQIKSGAPVDIFFSAAQDKVDALIKEKLIDAADSKTVIKNHLVVASQSEIKQLDALTNQDIKKIAIGNPDLVPAGAYGKEALENADIYTQIEERLVLAKDVRQVLTYVETQNVDAGIVYASDIKTSKKIKHTYKINDELHGDIVYPIAQIKSTKHPQESKKLFQYLQSNKSKVIYKSHGFDIK